ncbi:purine-nucleoside phosphorylase [Murimonas intestini]|uniref:Purine nucleoside phosphorylase n=1 Tax=Murimonas intestini TaxID=1337051 RepID=A0AB73T3S7_9FIRM|nr:purine-nucleoside phosphorylase [Murimonas intestini]MCR1841109.1 purine-nucleoside phosphorylase [Murimonas intestini]MCR1865774.1 purine-nucleoside phosphorylase [Murimonas intestini]MCR1883194.1 purine-nucleoside phosphorylase [Murimonas intestini]
MNQAYEKLLRCYESFKSRIDFKPEVALILGSGLGDYGESIQIEAVLDYHDIEGFPVSTVPGHKGRFLFGYVGEVPVVIMQGRVHYYEGYAMEDVVLPTRLMKMMGARVLFLTNAAGGVNYDFAAGDFMMITDQISNFVPSPLIGPNIDELGLRFSDMSEIYDKDLREILRSTARELDIPLKEGVYVQLTGPNFETPSEVKMCRILGGDAVGMSTACEAVAANHMGMKICGISCISNLGCGMTDEPLSHEEVQETADRVAPLFKELITASIIRIGKMLEKEKKGE